MKIVILSRNKRLFSTKRLIEAARARGHQVRVLDPLHCYMNIASDSPSVRYRGKEISRTDAIIPRIGASITFYGMAVLRQFEMMGVYAVNSSAGVACSRDKLQCLQLLSREGLGLPVTGFAHSPDDTGDLIKMSGGPPLIIKLLEGAQGRGVVLAETLEAGESVIDAFRSINVNILTQEFIKEAGGSDIRCFVVGDRVVAAMKRQAKPGDFRSNLHRGGSASLVSLTKEEEIAAVKAAQAMGLSVSGVDILRSSRGPLVIEVNSSPGLEGIEECTGVNVAGAIIEFIESKVGKTEERGKKRREQGESSQTRTKGKTKTK